MDSARILSVLLDQQEYMERDWRLDEATRELRWMEDHAPTPRQGHGAAVKWKALELYRRRRGIVVD